MLSRILRMCEAVSSEQKATALKLKQFFKKNNLKVHIKGSSGKSDYIDVWNFDSTFSFPEKLGHDAHKAKSSPSRHKDGPWSGNIQTHKITLERAEWERFMDPSFKESTECPEGLTERRGNLPQLLAYWTDKVKDDDHPWSTMLKWAKENPSRIDKDPEGWASWMHHQIFGKTPSELSKSKEKAKNESTSRGVANTILQQLGGNKFIAMTGAKNFLAGDYKLMFMLGRNKLGANKVIITLNGKDLYDIEFGKVRSSVYKTLKTYEDVYGSSLQSIFTKATGLNTTL